MDKRVQRAFSCLALKAPRSPERSLPLPIPQMREMRLQWGHTQASWAPPLPLAHAASL